MPIFHDHSYTSITIKINQLSSQSNNELDDSIELYLSDLIQLIKIQPGNGAIEAARAIRKKVKYGDSIKEQIRSLQILELLVLNTDKSIGSTIARDDKLLDVLKGIINGHGKTGSGTNYDSKVQNRVISLALGWRNELQDMVEYKYMQQLYKYIPKKKIKSRSQSEEFEQPFENEIESDNSDSPPAKPTKSPPPPRPKKTFQEVTKKSKKKSKSKKKKGIIYADEDYAIPQINYKVEAPRIRELISSCHTHTTILDNLLTHCTDSPLDDDKILNEFQKNKKIRRKVLNYLQYVGAGTSDSKSSEYAALDEEFLGSLISANESLVEVFKKFDLKAGYNNDNPAPNYDEETESDESYYTSEDEDAYEDEQDSLDQRLQEVSLKSPPPPPPNKLNRPILNKMETLESIEGDPFGDRNAVNNSKSIYE
ncbi:unnamed protein product [Candida verbasci]|uniref:VHS domain-containing protein n=1 Tax=Candida verbasci TaxID=1227364 RepID=A0A9W4TY44_9ASCO|nr:unnamed protein product [Candida verbasci]